VLGVVIFWQLTDRSEKRRRAEIYMLETIRAQMSQDLVAGTNVPTNWLSLSNAINWELVAEICASNGLPDLTQLYNVLPKGVLDKRSAGMVFLVRRESCSWPGLGRGRWALAARTSEWTTEGQSNKWSWVPSSNQVSRIWLPDPYLSPEISSQITGSSR